MSGGHWGYMAQRIEEATSKLMDIGKALAWIEHEVDWAMCGDTCEDCASEAALPWLKVLFDVMSGLNHDDVVSRLQAAQDLNRCSHCAARLAS